MPIVDFVLRHETDLAGPPAPPRLPPPRSPSRRGSRLARLSLTFAGVLSRCWVGEAGWRGAGPGPRRPRRGTEAAGGLYGGGGGSVAGQCGTLRAGAGGDGGRRGAAPRPAGGAGGPRSAARAPAAGRGAGAGGGGRAPAGAGEGGRRPPPASSRPRPPRRRRRSSRRGDGAGGGGSEGEGRGGARGRRSARRRSPAAARGARAPGRARTKRRRGGGGALDGRSHRPVPARSPHLHPLPPQPVAGPGSASRWAAASSPPALRAPPGQYLPPAAPAVCRVASAAPASHLASCLAPRARVGVGTGAGQRRRSGSGGGSAPAIVALSHSPPKHLHSGHVFTRGSWRSWVPGAVSLREPKPWSGSPGGPASRGLRRVKINTGVQNRKVFKECASAE
ncbi:collagen alpha-1(III) chain-like [Strigops habroptila]|uniref:collagen alpha-1(III) chain-like n=1 Tax=Strigops habroptila TaxID=2489341 RepID=UPI0014022CD0|nr:collagen alpha-1(III) chain-like [Strigops habroptila]